MENQIKDICNPRKVNLWWILVFKVKISVFCGKEGDIIYVSVVRHSGVEPISEGGWLYEPIYVKIYLPRPKCTTLHFIFNSYYFIFTFTREHHEVTARSMAINIHVTAEVSLRAMEEITGHSTTTPQHTRKRILGASGGCESRLLKNTKERSSPSLCWQVVNKLTYATRLVPVIAT